MKKVLIVVPSLGTGGGEKLALDLAININKNEYQTAILSLFPKQGMIFESIAEKYNIKIYYINKNLGFDIKAFFRVFTFIKKFKPDVIHTHLNVIPHILHAILLTGIQKRFHTVHSIASKEASGMLKILMSLSYKFFGFTPVAISDFVKQTICEEYKLPSDKVPCIYNGIDNQKFFRDKKTTKSDDEVHFITIGTLYPVKNHNLMLEAFSEVHKLYDKIKLTIVGDGEYRNDVIKKIESLSLQKDVFLTGIVENVTAELNKADIFLMTSNYEGLPLSVLEAMACGLPIITTKAGGVIDVVKNDVNGKLTEIGNKQHFIEAMIYLIENKNLRLKYGEESYKMSKKYTINECVMKYEQLYNR